MSSYQKRLEALLKSADVKVNPTILRDHDIKLKDGSLLKSVTSTRVAGELYMSGDADCANLEEMAFRVIRTDHKDALKGWEGKMLALRFLLFNLQDAAHSFLVGKMHYDLGNEFYRFLLGSTMTYSCAVWDNANTLDEAQIEKYERICRKLHFERYTAEKPGLILEIGCGWGGFAKYACRKYHVKVVGMTISKEQAAYAIENCDETRGRILFGDYRKVDVLSALRELDPNATEFDCAVSIGMFEHVGPRNYKTYMKFAFKHLRKGGLFLCHTIIGRGGVDPFIEKYIFPGGYIPALWQVMKAAHSAKFVEQDVDLIGMNYQKTLVAWHSNLVRYKKEIERVVGQNVIAQFGSFERFFRAFEFYLLTCAASFRAQRNSVAQVVLSKGAIEGGYSYSLAV